jgi:hypothetical protein
MLFHDARGRGYWPVYGLRDANRRALYSARRSVNAVLEARYFSERPEPRSITTGEAIGITSSQLQPIPLRMRRLAQGLPGQPMILTPMSMVFTNANEHQPN